MDLKVKLCPVCRQEKDIADFGLNKQRKDGLRYECKLCRKQHYYDNHEEMLEAKRNDYLIHKEDRNNKDNQKYQSNPEKFKKRSKIYYHSNREIISKRSKAYREKNRETILLKKREYEQKRRDEKLKQIELFNSQLITVEFPETYKICSKCHTLKSLDAYNKKRAFCKECHSKDNKQYRKDNGDIIRAKERQKCADNPLFYKEKRRKLRQTEEYKTNRKATKNRLISNMTQYIRCALSEAGLKKDGKATMKYVGCTRGFFRNHLAAQFQEGMHWDNYGNKDGYWSLDHYIPREAFNLLNPEEQDVCFHWTNCQPMWHKDNEIKQDQMPDGRKARNTKNEYSLEDKKYMINERIKLLSLPINI